MRKRRPSGMRPLGDILQASLEKIHITVDRERGRRRRLWDAAVGPRIAAQTDVWRLARRTLYITVSNAAWMQELLYLKADLLARVSAAFEGDEVRDIRFGVGEIPRHRAKAAAAIDIGALWETLRERDRRMVEESLAAVVDPDLREVMRRVMIREIGRRRLQGKRPAS